MASTCSISASVCGGSTSNCVRATVYDASSYNFRTIVAQDCVFDRIPVSHAISLFDMDRQYADVMSRADICAHLERTPAAGSGMQAVSPSRGQPA